MEQDIKQQAYQEVFNELNKLMTVDTVHPRTVNSFRLSFDNYVKLAEKFNIPYNKDWKQG